MRGTIDGLGSAHRIADALPSMLAEDPFAQQWCAGLDEVLAPVVLTLDCWPAYLDPATAPADMLDWLTLWLGLESGAELSLDRQRSRVAGAADLHARRGTLRGIELAVESAFGLSCRASDSGGVAVSTGPGAALPGSPDPAVLVVVSATDRSAIDVERLEAVVGAAVPAHVSFRVEVELS